MSSRTRESIVLALWALAALGACSDDGNNRPPTVFNPQAITDEDVPVAISLLEGASDPDGDTLRVNQADATDHATDLLADGVVMLTPKRDFHGTIMVSFGVTDGTVTVLRQVTVTVRPVNDGPVATGGLRNVRRTTALVLEGRDVDGDALTYEVVTGPAHGTLSGDPPALQYTPAVDFVGEDVVTYRVSDASLTSEPATVRLQVSADAAPVARAGTATINEDSPVLVTLSASDSDGDALTFTIVTPPAHGTLSGTGPAVTYTPAPNFSGSDSLVFSASDGFLTSQTAAFTIDVKPVNDAPAATPQTIEATEDVNAAITLAGSDPDGDALTFQVQSGPGHGVLLGSGAARTYRPDPNYRGPDSFTFVVSDGARSSAPATVTIQVASVNDPPVAVSFSRTLAEDGSVSTTLTSNDIDGPFGISHAIVTPPAHGTLVGFAPQLTYFPDANYNGPDSFVYTAFDGEATSAPATVTITVTAVNDRPVASASAVTTSEDTPIAITLQASDADGQALSYFIDVHPIDGFLTGSGANRTYTPAANASGTRSFSFSVFDGQLFSSLASVTITIAPVNDPPRTVDDYLAAEPGAPLAFSVTSNDVDIEGDAIELATIGEPAHGTLAIDGDELVYTPDADFTGVDVFAYEVVDAHGDSSAGSVHIGVGQFPAGAPTEAVATSGPGLLADAPTALSGDGRYIAFHSALPLLADDSNGLHDVYLFDRGRRALTRISGAMGGGVGNGMSVRPAISADGRYIVFDSAASNLVAGDTNARVDVFRHDRVTGVTVRVSVATGGGQANGDSVGAKLSDDGNLVAFRSTAFDLVAGDTNGASDIFVRDLSAGATTRISVSAAGGDADLPSVAAVISGDGRFVAFASSATNLVAVDTNNVSDVFVRDRIQGTTTRVSVSTNGGQADAACGSPSISRDGGAISFLSDATNLVPDASGHVQLYVRDVQAQITLRPALSTTSDVLTGQLSGDGRYVTVSIAFDGVRIHDRFAAITLTPPGSFSWFAPAISGNGRYVVVVDDTNRKVVVTPNTL